MAIVWKIEDEAERVLLQRRAFRQCVAALAAPPSDLDSAELIYGELVANTVRYAGGAVEARLELTDSESARARGSRPRPGPACLSVDAAPGPPGGVGARPGPRGAARP